jgi:hypothetical protein
MSAPTSTKPTPTVINDDFLEGTGKFDFDTAITRLEKDPSYTDSYKRMLKKKLEIAKDSKAASTITVAKTEDRLAWGWNEAQDSVGRKGGVADDERKARGFGGKGFAGISGDKFDEVYDYMVRNSFVKFDNVVNKPVPEPAPEPDPVAATPEAVVPTPVPEVAALTPEQQADKDKADGAAVAKAGSGTGTAPKKGSANTPVVAEPVAAPIVPETPVVESVEQPVLPGITANEVSGSKSNPSFAISDLPEKFWDLPSKYPGLKMQYAPKTNSLYMYNPKRDKFYPVNEDGEVQQDNMLSNIEGTIPVDHNRFKAVDDLTGLPLYKLKEEFAKRDKRAGKESGFNRNFVNYKGQFFEVKDKKLIPIEFPVTNLTKHYATEQAIQSSTNSFSGPQKYKYFRSFPQYYSTQNRVNILERPIADVLPEFQSEKNNEISWLKVINAVKTHAKGGSIKVPKFSPGSKIYNPYTFQVATKFQGKTPYELENNRPYNISSLNPRNITKEGITNSIVSPKYTIDPKDNIFRSSPHKTTTGNFTLHPSKFQSKTPYELAALKPRSIAQEFIANSFNPAPKELSIDTEVVDNTARNGNNLTGNTVRDLNDKKLKYDPNLNPVLNYLLSKPQSVDTPEIPKYKHEDLPVIQKKGLSYDQEAMARNNYAEMAGGMPKSSNANLVSRIAYAKDNAATDMSRNIMGADIAERTRTESIQNQQERINSQSRQAADNRNISIAYTNANAKAEQALNKKLIDQQRRSELFKGMYNDYQGFGDIQKKGKVDQYRSTYAINLAELSKEMVAAGSDPAKIAVVNAKAIELKKNHDLEVFNTQKTDLTHGRLFDTLRKILKKGGKIPVMKSGGSVSAESVKAASRERVALIKKNADLQKEHLKSKNKHDLALRKMLHEREKMILKYNANHFSELRKIGISLRK